MEADAAENSKNIDTNADRDIDATLIGTVFGVGTTGIPPTRTGTLSATQLGMTPSGLGMTPTLLPGDVTVDRTMIDLGHIQPPESARSAAGRGRKDSLSATNYSVVTNPQLHVQGGPLNESIFTLHDLGTRRSELQELTDEAEKEHAEAKAK